MVELFLDPNLKLGSSDTIIVVVGMVEVVLVLAIVLYILPGN